MLFPVSKTAFLPLVLWSFAAGILLGAIYDVFRIRRYAFRETKSAGKLFSHVLTADTVICFFEDIILALFCAVVMILLCFKFGFGVPRWYGGAALIGGFGLYHVTVGKLVMSSVKRILHFILLALKFVLRHTAAPLKALARKTVLRAFLALDEKSKMVYTERQEERFLTRLDEAMREDTEIN